MRRARSILALVALTTVAAGVSVRSQGPAAPAVRSAKAAAPIDVTGYWVSVVNEDWRFRMITPAKGDYGGIPITKEALQIVNAWNPSADESAGNQCKSYGAAAIMRVPGRLHVTWQGYSAAFWAGVNMGRAGRTPGPNGNLGVVTTKMKAGYLRKNGVPYSESTSLQEYFDTFTEPEGTSWLVVTSIITDPAYLTGPYATTNHFKKIPDMQGWDPTPCRPDQPR
jgi:hypothetical protein